MTRTRPGPIRPTQAVAGPRSRIVRRFGAMAIALLGAAACRPGPPTALPLPDRFSNMLLSRIGAPREVPPCPVSSWNLGPTARARLRRYHVTIPLPTSYLPTPSFEALRPVMVEGFGVVQLEEWREGLHLTQPGFHRWARVADATGTPDPNTPETMVQLLQLRGFQTFYAAPPWRVSEGTQCTTTVGGRPARVITFRLIHPTLPGHWGVTAFWRGSPDDRYLSLLGLGPDPAAQAEMMAILQAIIP